MLLLLAKMIERAVARWYGRGVATIHLGTDGRIETTCPDCGEPLSCAVRDRRPDDPDLLFHCFVPAAAWWDDIVFT